MSSTEIVLASTQLSTRLGVEKDHMIDTIKAQCFRALRPEQVTDTQLAAYVQIANNLNLNPLLPGMLYAYPERNGGITPIIGPDGIFSLLSNNSDIEGWTTKHEKIDGEDTCTAIIKHKRLGDLSKTVFLSEWKVGNNPNWVQRPRHMLEIRALKQCARQVIHGIPFDEEERHTAEINVTGTGGEGQQPEGADKRPAAPTRRGSVKAANAETTNPTTVTDPKAGAIEVETVPPVTEKPVEKPATVVTAAQSEAAVEPAKPVEKLVTPEPPEVAPGVSITGFHGKAWPQLLRVEVVSRKLGKTPQAKGVVIIEGRIDGHEGTLEVVTFEHVRMNEGGKPEVTAAFLAVGKSFEANILAKIRPGREGQPDYTKPPALYAEQVSESTAVESF